MRDPRFDGRFFVAVTSTRIYCRPICTVKTPKFENCRFFESAAIAEAAGFRPCLRCRPELAPGQASVDARSRLVRRAVRLIEEGESEDGGLERLANELQVSTRHLRRTFQSELGVSPVEFAQTQRLLLAKRLLTDTRMSVTDAAFAAGFGSVRRLNALFRARYRLSPSQIRKKPAPDGGALRFEFGFRPPYDWLAFLQFLRMRCVAGLDEVDDGRYRRTVSLKRDGKAHAGWIEIGMSSRKPSLEVLVSESLRSVLPAVLTRVRSLTDVCANPCEIQERLGALAAARPGLRVPGAFDGFEIAMRSILGQQVSIKAARTLLARLVERFGVPQNGGIGGLNRAFPFAEDIAGATYEEVAGLGMPKTRAVSVVEMAKAVASGFVNLNPCTDVEECMRNMRTLPGIGEWTAQYVAMRALNWPDAFPHTDLVLMQALGERNPRKVLALAEGWRPWRAYAVMHLWMGSFESATLSRSA